MAHGYPDYFGQSVWPKYGEPVSTDETFTVTAGTSEDVLDLTCQGVLYFLLIHVWTTAALYNLYVKVTIDGTVLFSYPITYPLYTGFFAPRIHPVVVTLYDCDDLQAFLSIPCDLPFKRSLKITLDGGLCAVDVEGMIKAMHYIVS